MSRGKVRTEDLLRIIDLCKVVENKSLDPFNVNIKKSIKTLKTHLPEWELLDELLLDSEALGQLASIINLQEEWIKHKASMLYIDPVLVELKIRLASPEFLERVFLRSWHPVVRIEQISSWRIKEALDYWNALVPLEERYRESHTVIPSTGGVLTISDLMKLRILSEEEFSKMIDDLLEDFRKKIGKKDGISYWDFISVDTYEETILRAYMTSFLISEGQVNLDVDPIEERISLSPNEKSKSSNTRSISRSIAISLQQGLKERTKVSDENV